MRPVRIEGADPKPLGAPRNWNPEMGRCGDLFVRREVVDGLAYMRSAWEAENAEGLAIMAGGKALLGVSGHAHPVVQMSVQPPSRDTPPAYCTRGTISLSGQACVRVDAYYPAVNRVCYCEVVMAGAAFADASAEAIRRCDKLAADEGWLTPPTEEDA